MIPTTRSTETVLHVANPPPDLRERLQAVPAASGSLTILRTPGKLAYQGTMPHLAHPLLVYTELLVSAEPQAGQTAGTLRERFLPDLASSALT